VEKHIINNKKKIKITEEGSLGILASGDIGIRAWRQVKRAAQNKRRNEEKK